MSLEAYDYIIVFYDMNIKYKMSKNLCWNSETVVLFNKQTLLLEYILFAMNVLLEYLNNEILYRYCDMKIFITVIEYTVAALDNSSDGTPTK